MKTLKEVSKRLAVFSLFSAISACALFTPANIHTAFDGVAIACIIARAELPVPEVQRACQIADALLPDLEKVLGDMKAESRRYAAEHQGMCSTTVVVPAPKDGGK